jgi:hypothetical protein
MCDSAPPGASARGLAGGNMEASNDYIVGFARSLKEKFERAEDGKAAIHIGEEKFIIYGPVFVGLDFLEFMLGPGPSPKLMLVPFHSIRALTF